MTTPSGEKFAHALGVPMPTCCSHGDCCKGASPSKPFYQLLAMAAEGNDFARNFFSIMVPYPDHAAAEAVVPGLVARTLNAARKQPQAFPDPENDLVFYHCRYLGADNRCTVYEDRPQFCRDYPESPFMVFAPGCAFEDWGAACRQAYQGLKTAKAQLETELGQTSWLGWDPSEPLILENLTLALSLTPLFLAAPMSSVWGLLSCEEF